MEGLIRAVVLTALLCTSTLAQTVETKVERADHDRPDKPTLRFLSENRDFLRAQLDRLRQIRVERDGEATVLSDRHLMFRGMLADILAAQDTLAAEQDVVDRRELLDRIGDLAGLEEQLDLVEGLLDEQETRLLQLERDFVGRQETALVFLVQGLPADAEPTGLVLTAGDGSVVRVPLGAAQRDALRRGGVAQIYHEFVEPRDQTLTLELDGVATHTIPFSPARDRINFVQIDLRTDAPAIERWAR